MAKKTIEPELVEIKKLLGNENLIIGKERTIKNLKLGKVEKIFLSSNCSADMLSDVENYARQGNVEIVKLNQNNKELGTICKKPFPISMLSLLKA